MRVRQEKGSALLIVLGMVAFIVISAVAFSAYMRYSRAPSSFLRQTISSRMLAKAALAEAIDEIDAAIGNNPHPGVGNDHSRTIDSRGLSQPAKGNNRWLGRVFIGGPKNGSTTTYDLAHPELTTATLTYEGLAYIPPAIVNEARYYSRYSNTAIWRNMDFDVGRYAYTAIDVSDFFDVNILQANAPRSSAPGSRITLSYLFEDQAPAWDEFMEFFRDPTDDGRTELGGHVPLVSVADLNLAIGKGGRAGIKSPFCEYDHQSGVGSFYGSISLEDIAAMTFITDSWFPGGEASLQDGADVANFCDLNANQPFSKNILDQPDPDYYKITEENDGEAAGSYASLQLHKFVPSASLAYLYDYLDEDRVPVSLSIPTAERVPMICGIEPKMDSASIKIEPTDKTEPDVPDAEADANKILARTMTRTISYKLNAGDLGAPVINMMTVYPFLHDDGVKDNNVFKLQGRASLFFTTDDMGLRPSSVVPVLQFQKYPEVSASEYVTDGVLSFKLNEKKPSFTLGTPEGSVDDSSNMSLEWDGDSMGDVSTKLQEDMFALLTAKFVWKQTRTIDPDTGAYTPWKPTFAEAYSGDKMDTITASCGLPALNKDGAIDSDFSKKDKELLDALKTGVRLKLNLAAWGRVLDTDKMKTVDMVPACGQDDLMNDIHHWEHDLSAGRLSEFFGDPTPLMRFDTGVDFMFQLDDDFQPKDPALVSAKSITISPKSVMVGDPRFNYAPESWFEYAAGGINKGIWLQENGANDSDKDGDIFMQTSDQGYMQSIYELANILSLWGRDGLRNSDGEVVGSLKRPESWSGPTFPAKSDAVNKHLMWCTYDPLGRYNGERFEDIGFVSRDNGFKVNPYTDSTNILMAVFANTPRDWRVASTNYLQEFKTAFKDISAGDFNEKYAWNQYSSGAKIDYADLEDLSGLFMSEMRKDNQDADDDWEQVWMSLKWYCSSEAETSLLDGLKLSSGNKLYNTDKKFLYGYWHDCFAVKQQLFLFFLRAEPSMMGGGQNNTTPPQLGARAVALVWRDPRPLLDGDDQSPHRTRILFYRQFD